MHYLIYLPPLRHIYIFKIIFVHYKIFKEIPLKITDVFNPE